MAGKSEVEKRSQSLWEEAYLDCKARKPHLIDACAKIAAAFGIGITETYFKDQVPKIVNQKIETMKSRQWKFTIRGKPRVLRDQIDRIVKIVEAVKESMSIAVGADPIHAGLPWAGVCLLLSVRPPRWSQTVLLADRLQLITNDSKQHADARNGLEEIVAIIVKYKDVEGIYLPLQADDIKSHLMEQMVSLYSTILEYQASAARFFAKDTFQRWLRNIPKLDDWGVLLGAAKIEDQKCYEYIQLKDVADVRASMQKQERALLDLSGIKAVLEDQQVEKITHHISPILVEDDHGNARSKLGSAYWNSGRWFFELPEYEAWRRSQSGIIWLKGGVGTGKTSLTSLVIEDAIERGKRLAFFYCSSDTSYSGQLSRASPINIIRSLLVQICFETVGTTASNPLTRKCGESPMRFYSRHPDIAECMTHLLDLAASGTSVLFIIDALDEIDDSDHVHVDGLFKDACIIPVTYSKTEADMVAYIDRELTDSDRMDESPLRSNPKLKADFKNLLLEKAQGMFRWVELQLEIFLERGGPWEWEEDIRQEMARVRDESQLATPSLLLAAYKRIFEINIRHAKHASSLAKKALKWMLCCWRPPTPGALALIVSIIPLNLQDIGEGQAQAPQFSLDNEVTEKKVMHLMSNFLVTDETGLLRFAHGSVKDYIQDKDYGLGLTTSSAQLQAAEICTAVLLHTCGEISCKQSNLLRSSDKLNPEAIAKDKSYRRVVFYSLAFWPVHCYQLTMEERSHGMLGHRLEAFLSPIANNLYQIWISVQIDKVNTLANGAIELHAGSDDLEKGTIDLDQKKDRHFLQEVTTIHRTEVQFEYMDFSHPILLAACLDFKEIFSKYSDTELVKVRDHHRKGAIHIAAATGHTDVFLLLVSRGVPKFFSTYDPTKRKPSAELVSSEEDVFMSHPGPGETSSYVELDRTIRGCPLEDALSNDRLDVVQYYAHHVDLTAEERTVILWQLLMWRPDAELLCKKKLEMVCRLLDIGIDLEATGSLNAPAFLLTSRGSDPMTTSELAICNALMRYGPNIRAQEGKTGKTSLHFMAARGPAPFSEESLTKMIRTLAEKGLSLDMRDTKGRSTLHYSTSAICAHTLISLGADPNIRDKRGQIPLHHRNICRNAEVMQPFLDCEADVKCLDDKKRTPLHYNVQLEGSDTDHTEISSFPDSCCGTVKLLRAGADVNARDVDGKTPLFFVRSQTAANHLIGAGADPELQDLRGRKQKTISSSLVQEIFETEKQDIEIRWPIYKRLADEDWESFVDKPRRQILPIVPSPTPISEIL